MSSNLKTIAELKDIVCNDMRGLYERGEAEHDIHEVIQLEREIGQEYERRSVDVKALIQGEIGPL